MSKLNKSSTVSNVEMGMSANGNVQYVKDSSEILFETVVSTLYGNDSYYESSNDKVERMKAALKDVLVKHGLKGAYFAGRVAKFAREEMFVRTMPIVMVVELLKMSHDLGIKIPNAKTIVSSVITRADQLTDLYAYALTVFESKNKIPMSIKNGVADSFNKFDAYQFGKYNRNEGLTVKSLLRIVHPIPKNEIQSAIFKKLMDDSLESPNTWEVLLSVNGQKPACEKKSDKDLWTELVNTEGSGSLGYMALLRNIRNICKAGVDDSVLSRVCSRISDEKEITKSKQFPWAFINAYEVAVAERLPQKVITSISKAADISIKNVPSIGNYPWIILDCSGSMSSISAHLKNNNTPIKVGAIFAAALFKASSESHNSALTLFSDNAANITLNPTDSIMTLYTQIMGKVYGGGTNLSAALALKPRLGFEPDAIVILSDMEVNPAVSSHYGLSVPPVDTLKLKKDCVKIAVNLNSGNTTPLNQRVGWQQLSGWSESIFKYIEFNKKSSSIAKTLMNEIKV
jgi:hypothetical protein